MYEIYRKTIVVNNGHTAACKKFHLEWRAQTIAKNITETQLTMAIVGGS